MSIFVPFAKARQTRRFRYGLIAIVASAVFLIMSAMNLDSAVQRVQSLENDPRFDAKTWLQKTQKEQDDLSREKLTAGNNLGQIKLGLIVFSITLTTGIILVIFSFVIIRSKADKLLEEYENEGKEQ